ncbi:hypothetical protein DFJ74DRAFT_650015 [Hyaloraphidium curvatum]|nr:hypothetical protein DFJ74DRAFT_650015 [Hyaloraphidium curvatum]
MRGLGARGGAEHGLGAVHKVREQGIRPNLGCQGGDVGERGLAGVQLAQHKLGKPVRVFKQLRRQHDVPFVCRVPVALGSVAGPVDVHVCGFGGRGTRCRRRVRLPGGLAASEGQPPTPAPALTRIMFRGVLEWRPAAPSELQRPGTEGGPVVPEVLENENNGDILLHREVRLAVVDIGSLRAAGVEDGPRWRALFGGGGPDWGGSLPRPRSNQASQALRGVQPPLRRRARCSRRSPRRGQLEPPARRGGGRQLHV